MSYLTRTCGHSGHYPSSPVITLMPRLSLPPPRLTVVSEVSSRRAWRGSTALGRLAVGLFIALLASPPSATARGLDDAPTPPADHLRFADASRLVASAADQLADLPVEEISETFADDLLDTDYELVPPAPDGDVRVLPPLEPSGPIVLDMPYEPFTSIEAGGCVTSTGFPSCFDDLWAPRPWCWHLMPNNLIYTSYLAGPKEPRFATVWYDDTEPSVINPNEQNGWLWDSTLGGRISLVRYGSDPVLHPQGFEVQLEGAAFVRLDPEDDRDLRSADYRFGIPIVYGVGRWQTKLAYYHNSAHLGDEFQIKYPWYERINYVRDVIVWGNSYYLYDWLRLYGEVGFSFFNSGGSEPWEFQYGTELIQARPTGIRGAPFLAVNGISRQELDWGGNVNVQVGWAWRGRTSEKLFRIGFEYLYGSDPQFEFFRRNQNPFVASDAQTNQNRAGIGMWYDY